MKRIISGTMSMFLLITMAYIAFNVVPATAAYITRARERRMKRETTVGILSALLLFAMLIATLPTKPVEAYRVTGATVWAIDADGDGWVTADGLDYIGVSWDFMGTGVLVSYELHADMMLTDQRFGYGLVGVTYTPQEVQQYFGQFNVIRVWFGNKFSDFADLSFNLPKPIVDFPVLPHVNGYIILVAGDRPDHSLKPEIDQACNQIFDDLVFKGYSGGRIRYLNNNWNWRVDDVATSANLQWAITNWAAERVGPGEPLFLLLFDHGSEDVFCVHTAEHFNEMVSAASLADWIDTLWADTCADVHVWYTGCHSGSFIDNLSEEGRVIITSCRPDEGSYPEGPPYAEYFSNDFWPRIRMGRALLSAFNPACRFAVPDSGERSHPLLDDDGDGVGHGFETPAGSGDLPHHGDGHLARTVRIGHCSWMFPWISQAIEERCYQWPPAPPEAIPLWAKVENKTPLMHVRAWMLPPDWIQPPLDEVLGQPPLELFEMMDSDGDGKWTVSIPPINFTEHATGPSEFEFMITAEEQNDSAIPVWTSVEFTDTGEPPQDTVKPWADVYYPLDLEPVEGIIKINGTAADDVCLKLVKLYANGNPSGIVTVLPASNSYFEFDFDTSTVPSGPITIEVKAVDTSDNEGTCSLKLNVNQDVAVTNVTLGKTVVGQTHSLPVNVTIMNEGSDTEVFKVIVYANATIIKTETLTLDRGSSTITTLTCNTTNLAKGYYTIRVASKFLPYETDATDNTFTDGVVWVKWPYDVTGDNYCGIDDIVAVAEHFGTSNALYDVTNDNYVGIDDIVSTAEHFGQTG